jgi:hypothetical protein
MLLIEVRYFIHLIFREKHFKMPVQILQERIFLRNRLINRNGILVSIEFEAGGGGF